MHTKRGELQISITGDTGFLDGVPVSLGKVVDLVESHDGYKFEVFFKTLPEFEGTPFWGSTDIDELVADAILKKRMAGAALDSGA